MVYALVVLNDMRFKTVSKYKPGPPITTLDTTAGLMQNIEGSFLSCLLFLLYVINLLWIIILLCFLRMLTCGKDGKKKIPLFKYSGRTTEDGDIIKVAICYKLVKIIVHTGHITGDQQDATVLFGSQHPAG